MSSKSALLDRIAVTVKEAAILIGTNDKQIRKLCTLESFQRRSSETHTALVSLTCGSGSMGERERCDTEGELASRVPKLAFHHGVRKTPLAAAR